MDPKVSIVIPIYNAVAFIENALASVAQQTFTDLEVIIVDDASCDDSVDRARAAIERHGMQHRILQQERNGGPALARNRGVTAARGKYIAFLDADDEWLPGKLAAQVAVLDADPSITLCGCQAIWVDEQGRTVRPLFRNLPARLPDGWKRLLWQCYVATPCAMVRRVDLGVRPFDPVLRVGEDRDLWIRLASNGVVALIPDIMARIRLADNSFMPSNATLIQVCTRPMIERHLHAYAEHLSLRDRLLIRGAMSSQIGKTLCKLPGRYAEGGRYMLASVLRGYHPLDGLRELLFHAPVLRDLKRLVKQALFVRNGLGGVKFLG